MSGPVPTTGPKEGFPFRYAYGSGYWISPNSRVFRVNPTHIAAICDHPDRFGLEEKQVRKLFDEANEPWRSEGEARKQIIIRLVQDGGWIRVREYRRGWTINLPELSPTSVARVRGFFLVFTEPGVPNNDVVLDHPTGQFRSSVTELVDGSSSALTAADFAHEVILPMAVTSPADIPFDGIPRLSLS